MQKFNFPSGTYVTATGTLFDSLGRPVSSPDGVLGPLSGSYSAAQGVTVTQIQTRASIAGKLTAVAQRLLKGWQQPTDLDALAPSDDVPTITASGSSPGGEGATREVHTFPNDDLRDDTPMTVKAASLFVCGFNPNLRVRSWGDSVRTAAAVSAYKTNGNQDQDDSIGYGINRSQAFTEFWLDSDVVYFRNQSGYSSLFKVYVNGKLCSPTAGTGVTKIDNNFQPNGVYTKLTWTTRKLRLVRIVWLQLQVPRTIYTKPADSIQPVGKKLRWLHFGDSFSQWAGTSDPSVGLTEYVHYAFGYNHDFINCAEGSTGLVDGQKVGEAPTNGVKPCMRLAWRLACRDLAPDVVSILTGHNDGNDPERAASELRLLLQEIYLDSPDCLVIVATSNASPGIIANGKAAAVEQALLAVCEDFPRVVAVPLQTQAPALLDAQNAVTYTGGDTVHPSILGHRALGVRVAQGIRDGINKLL